MVTLVPAVTYRACFDHAVVSQGDADAGVRAEQGVLADGVLELAAAGQGAHDGRAAADVGAVADHDALRDAAFDHGDAEGARIEVHEAGVHDGGAFGQVRAQSHAVGVADAHAGRHDVVDHAGELVNRQHVHIDVRCQHGSGLSGGGHHVKLAQSEIVDGDGP